MTLLEAGLLALCGILFVSFHLMSNWCVHYKELCHDFMVLSDDAMARNSDLLTALEEVQNQNKELYELLEKERVKLESLKYLETLKNGDSQNDKKAKSECDQIHESPGRGDLGPLSGRDTAGGHCETI